LLRFNFLPSVVQQSGLATSEVGMTLALCNVRI